MNRAPTNRETLLSIEEAKIDQAIPAIREFGNELIEIRDQRLYWDEFGCFEEFLAVEILCLFPSDWIDFAMRLTEEGAPHVD